MLQSLVMAGLDPAIQGKAKRCGMPVGRPGQARP
jgi:hypothetical protein